jgi:hypothetical protein
MIKRTSPNIIPMIAQQTSVVFFLLSTIGKAKYLEPVIIEHYLFHVDACKELSYF